MSVPPDPTQRTPSRPPATVPAYGAEPVYLEPDEVLWRDEVRSRLRSVAAALTVAIAVAFIALGVAVWSLLDDPADNRGVNGERFRALEERVERLESASGRGTTREELRGVQAQQRLLEQRLATLGQSVEQRDDDMDALRTAADATQQAVEQLDQRIAAMEQAAP
jgi:hypothetical protein